MEEITYIIENTEAILNQRVRGITQKMRNEDLIFNQSRIDPKSKNGIIEKKLENYSHFI